MVSVLEQAVKDLFHGKMTQDLKTFQQKRCLDQIFDHTLGYDRQAYKKIKETTQTIHQRT